MDENEAYRGAHRWPPPGLLAFVQGDGLEQAVRLACNPADAEASASHERRRLCLRNACASGRLINVFSTSIEIAPERVRR
jgi:hypothetical protein